MLLSFACANAANNAIKLLTTSLRGELRLAPHAPSPGWHGSIIIVIIVIIIIVTIVIIDATFR